MCWRASGFTFLHSVACVGFVQCSKVAETSYMCHRWTGCHIELEATTCKSPAVACQVHLTLCGQSFSTNPRSFLFCCTTGALAVPLSAALLDDSLQGCAWWFSAAGNTAYLRADCNSCCLCKCMC
jgi:hypothetical protein